MIFTINTTTRDTFFGHYYTIRRRRHGHIIDDERVCVRESFAPDRACVSECVRAPSLSHGAAVELLAGAFVCERARRPPHHLPVRVLVCVCTQTTKIERPFYCFANDDNARKDKPAAAVAAATDPSSHKTASVAKTV